MKSDIEIARECKLDRIEKIAEKAGVAVEDIYPYGHHIAKVPLSYIDEEKIKKSNLILVTAIVPQRLVSERPQSQSDLTLVLTRSARRQWWCSVSHHSDHASA